jgi:hypothetical protein
LQVDLTSLNIFELPKEAVKKRGSALAIASLEQSLKKETHPNFVAIEN